MSRISSKRIASLTLALFLIWIVASIVCLMIGSIAIPLGDFVDMMRNRLTGDRPADARLEAILFSVRMPRVLLSSLVGAALAVAGAAFQSLLRNPLADPYVLGVSSGASMGTILYSVFAASIGIQAGSGRWLYMRPLAAFTGAVLTIGAVYAVARGSEARGRETPQRLLLAGIVLASFISSVNVFLLTSTNQADLRGIFYWLIGDLSRPVDRSILAVLAVVLAGAAVLFLLSYALNLLATGEEDAQSLGVEVGKVKAVVYIVASLITGAVVSVSGPIAYVGLICPHMVRMIFGSDNRILLPTVFVFGGIFTMLADTLARTLLSPVELPVGVITAICGAPLFIYLLHRRRTAP